MAVVVSVLTTAASAKVNILLLLLMVMLLNDLPLEITVDDPIPPNVSENVPLFTVWLVP